jgi:hypothetical protein
MSAATVQAIETRYRGYRFRSRLEARWAVAFGELGIEWSYETEGYRLPSGELYLPDFRLTTASFPNLAVEVKGDFAEYDGWKKLWEFAQFEPLLLLSNIPEPQPGAHSPVFPMLRAEYSHQVEWVWFDRRGVCLLSFQLGSGFRVPACTAAESAFYAARGARFEHGEQP